MSAPDLAGWTPFRVARRHDGMIVDWCRLGELRPVEPFFRETLARAFTRPFNLAFQRRTPITALAALPRGLRPSGFVFHMSRCGSTLCAQALARDPAYIVLAEPAPVSAVLRAPMFGPASEDDVAGWLDGIVNALTQSRFPDERRSFVKFAAADVLRLPTIRRVFPDVPWIFLYRDPGEVLASHHALQAPEMIPGHIDPRSLGLTAGEATGMAFEDYGARCLAAFAAAALGADRDARGLFLCYDDLVGMEADRAWSLVRDHFGIGQDRTAAALAFQIAHHAKRPGRNFIDDRAAKREAARAWRPTLDRIVGPAMEALDARRPPALP